MTTSRPLPRSAQISEILIREIASGLLPDGARLPTERSMAADYGVAVGTLRKALAILEQHGLLERVQGSGNYIRRCPNVKSVYASFHLERIGGGGLPTARILSLAEKVAPSAARAFGFMDRATQIDRIRLLDGAPVARERIWLNGSYPVPDVQSEISESLYAYYRDRLGLVVSRVEDSVGVDILPAWADLPGLLEQSPVGMVERRAWDQSNAAAEYSRTWFNPAQARFITRTDINTDIKR
ncbi:MAG: GntR family transcriptional regulator [Litorimonas sp.]